MKSSLEIAQEAVLEPIASLAERVGLERDEIQPYGRYKAKVALSVIDRLEHRPRGKLVCVTGMTPTNVGEGNTTTLVGLTQGLGAIGKRPVACLREPSLGPAFGVKGGAAGGGLAQVVPMEDINLHFTGDIHAIGAANNLLAAMIDASILHGNHHRIDALRISWRRALDVNDRVLRRITVGLGGRANGYARETGFDITAASEVMAVMAVARDLRDLRRRLGAITAAHRYDGAGPVTAEQLERLCCYLECSAVSGNGFQSTNPGRDVQRVGTARFLGEDVAKIHDPVWGVTGSLGDSQCYLGVLAKVAAIQAALSQRVRSDKLAVRLIAPAYTIGVSDGQLNGTSSMRFSLIGRELVNENIDLHLNANHMAGLVAVVACDKPPVGTLAAILEHNAPAVLLSDGSIKPGTDPETGERIDLVTGFQVAGDPDSATRTRIALHACPGQGSCGGMFTYNTMQTFIAVLGMEPLQMVAPPSDDPRRLKQFPDQLIDCLVAMTDAGITPRDIVTPASLRNALTVTIAMGGSTNVLLHSVEIARAAGFELWDDVLSQSEFNALSRRLPVLVNMRPFGFYSMVDIDAKGGLQVIVKELLEAGLLDGEALTCTGETLAEQIRRLDPPAPDGDVIHPVAKPYKATGGLRLLHGNLAPDGGAVLKIAGVEGGLQDGVFRGRARVFNSEGQLIEALEQDADSFADHDMVVIRYEGPRGAPGMPELLDPTSRITTLCRQRNITIALMTDARFSGGSVGLVIGHVAPEACLGGPIALIEDGDTIVVDVNADRMDCLELDDADESAHRAQAWRAAGDANGGAHPDVTPVSSRVLTRMRTSARSALRGAGMAPG